MGHKKLFGIEFQHTMKVDESHKVYYTGTVNIYYAQHKMDRKAIEKDIENMLDEFNITDYSELYLYFENDEMRLVTVDTNTGEVKKYPEEL